MEKLMYADGLISDTELQHYGIPKKSGRYPWGSGENPYHHGASAPGGRRANANARKDRKQAVKNRRTLTDDELTRRITRLEKEKKLKELTYDDLYPARRVVNEALKDIGKKTLVVGGTAAGVVAVNYLISNMAGTKVPTEESLRLFKDYLKPKKK